MSSTTWALDICLLNEQTMSVKVISNCKMMHPSLLPIYDVLYHTQSSRSSFGKITIEILYVLAKYKVQDSVFLLVNLSFCPLLCKGGTLYLSKINPLNASLSSTFPLPDSPNLLDHSL